MSQINSDNEKGTKKNSQTELELIPREEATHLLTGAARNFAQSFFWAANQSKASCSELVTYDVINRLLVIKRPKNISVDEFLDGLINSGCNFINFSITLSNAIVLFRSEFLKIQNGHFAFKLPDKVFKIQRRKSQRHIIPNSHVLKVEFDNPTYGILSTVKKLYDISANGCSFCVSLEDGKMFDKGLMLKNLSFMVHGHGVCTDAKVMHQSVITDGHKRGFIKIGIMFVDITNIDSRAIYDYVLEESMKRYSSFL